MAQPDAPYSSHVAIDIDDAGDGRCCCPVCMEPSEWVAVGRCGHREVCVACSARMRFFKGDRRCCICRELCPAVLVTKAAADDSSQQQAAVFSRPSPSFFGDDGAGPGRVAMNGDYWYHGGMAAYFDDQEQYEAVTKMCLTKPSRPAAGAAVENTGGAAPPVSSSSHLAPLVICTVAMALLGAAAGLSLEGYLKHWPQKVAVVLGCSLLFAVVACIALKIWGPDDMHD